VQTSDEVKKAEKPPDTVSYDRKVQAIA